MGLHNKYPAYFYRRGNLFNTYLGYTEDHSTSKQADEKPGESRHRNNRRRWPVKQPINLGSELHEFFLSYCTEGEVALFVERVTRHLGRPLPATRGQGVWLALRQLIYSLPADLQRKYLAELQRRHACREPLVRR